MRARRFAAVGWALTALIGCGGAGQGHPEAPASSPAPPALDAPGASSGPDTSDSPASPELLAGIKAFDAGNFADARSSFQAAAKKNAGDFQAFYNLGMSCEKLQDRPCAEQAYKSALAIKPDLDTAAAELAALYIDAGRTGDAIAVARGARSKRPKSAVLHENLGIALAAQGAQDDAMSELEQAAQITPADPMVHLTIAHWLNVWHAKGATAHLDAARDLVKDDFAMSASVGYEYRMAGEFDACVQVFDREIATRDGGEVRTERALCRLGLKDEKGTTEDLEAAIAKEPAYAPAHYYLGGRLALGRRFKDAAAQYGTYLQLAPNGSLAKAAAERLKAVQEAMRRGGKKK